MENKDVLKMVNGHWVDINSDTTLDFKKDKLTVKCPWYEKKYKVIVKGDSAKYLENAEEGSYGGFYDMSSIRIMDDGSLMSQQMVLDAKGHEYYFVREEQWEKENQIKIEDKDLPKTIESEDITSFSLNISTESTSFDIPAGSQWQKGRYVFDVTKTDNDEYELSLRGMGSSYIIMQYKCAVSKEWVKGLVDIINEQKLAENNGWYRSNNQDYEGWSVYIKYESGEVIDLSAYGKAALECPFSPYAFLDYAYQEASKK